MTDILQFTRLPWLSILNAASQARKQTVQRLLRFSFLKNTVALPCNSPGQFAVWVEDGAYNAASELASVAWRFRLGALKAPCYEAGESRETARRLGREQLRANFAASPGRGRGASPVPGSFLVPRSVDGKGVAGLFVLCSKVDFPRKFGTLHNIDLLQLPQTPSKFNLPNKKDQVSFSSDRHNVNAGRYCTETNKPFHKLRIYYQHPSLY